MVSWGGAVARVGQDASPLSARDARFVVHPFGMWEDPADDAANIEWARGFRDDLAAFSTGAVYLNFVGDEGEARVRAGYGPGSYERLAWVKAVWDPDNVFRAQRQRPAADGGREGGMSRDRGLIVGAVGISALGDFLLWIPLTLHIHEQTGSGAAVAALMICLWGPIVLLAPAAGMLADRFETRAAADLGVAGAGGRRRRARARARLDGRDPGARRAAGRRLRGRAAGGVRARAGDRPRHLNGAVEAARYVGHDGRAAARRPRSRRPAAPRSRCSSTRRPSPASRSLPACCGRADSRIRRRSASGRATASCCCSATARSASCSPPCSRRCCS